MTHLRTHLFATAAILAAIAAAAPVAARELTIAIPDNLTTLDPHDTNDTLSMSVERSMLQGLFGFDKDMRIVPLLAESYESNDTATEFVIHLRHGVKFQDGTDFNAAAVKANLDRISDPASHLKRHSLLNMIDRTDIIDDNTVKVYLKTPFGALINTLAHPAAAMHSPRALAQYGGDIGRHPVGTGPFKFVSWQNDTLKTTKFDGYWREGYPKVDGITFRTVPEGAARVAMLQTGEAQFIYPVPTEMIPVIKGKPGIAFTAAPSVVVRYVAMNVMKKPLDDVRVRRAINYAIDRDAFVKVVYGGYAQPANSPLADNVQFHVSEGGWPYDLAKAKALMHEAGLDGGFDVELLGNNNSTVTRGLQFLQQQLSQINVRVRVTPMEVPSLSQKVWSVQKPEDATVQMISIGASTSTGDADWALRPLLASESVPPHSLNGSYYQSKKVDAFIQAGLATTDSAKRAEAYKEAQAEIWNDAPWIFLAYENLLYAEDAKLTGVYLLPDNSLSMELAEFK